MHFGRVLGLGLEQVLKFLIGGGGVGGSCSYVVFSSGVHRACSAEGHIGVPLASQHYLHNLGRDVFTLMARYGFHILGVDVPQRHDATKSFDLVGVLREGSVLDSVGPATAEIFMTALPWVRYTIVESHFIHLFVVLTRE